MGISATGVGLLLRLWNHFVLGVLLELGICGYFSGAIPSLSS